MTSPNDRSITNDDLWAAIRGLGMHSRTSKALRELIGEHQSNPLFASRVIAEAARQVLATMPYRGEA